MTKTAVKYISEIPVGKMDNILSAFKVAEGIPKNAVFSFVHMDINLDDLDGPRVVISWEINA